MEAAATSNTPPTSRFEFQGPQPLERATRISAAVSFVALSVLLGGLFYATAYPVALGAAVGCALLGVVALITCHPKVPAIKSIARALFGQKPIDLDETSNTPEEGVADDRSEPFSVAGSPLAQHVDPQSPPAPLPPNDSSEETSGEPPDEPRMVAEGISTLTSVENLRELAQDIALPDASPIRLSRTQSQALIKQIPDEPTSKELSKQEADAAIKVLPEETARSLRKALSRKGSFLVLKTIPNKAPRLTVHTRPSGPANRRLPSRSEKP